MKTKEKEIESKIKELCELMGDDDNYIIFHENDENVRIAMPKDKNGADTNIAVALARVIDEYLRQKTTNEGVMRLSKIIVGAIATLISDSPESSIRLLSVFTKSTMNGIENMLDELCDLADSDDADDSEDCETCELLDECDQENAIKYRKEHGIPKPKKRDKRERKMKGGRKSK
jgi:hypothetical protein